MTNPEPDLGVRGRGLGTVSKVVTKGLWSEKVSDLEVERIKDFRGITVDLTKGRS